MPTLSQLLTSIEIRPSDKELLKALASGDTYRQAGIRINRSYGSVMDALERLRAGFGARNTVQLVAKAIREGIIT